MSISVIIPTYNRPHFLERLLRYYRELNLPYRIVVADSSLAPEREANQKVVAYFDDDLNIQYELYPAEINPVFIPLFKVAQVLEKVDSKYAVICGDDDFIVPKAMEQCVRFLEANPDYSIAHGRAAAVFVPMSGADRNSHRGLQTVTCRLCIIEADDPKVRLESHLRDWQSTLYSVHRRSDLIRNMKLAYDNTIDARFGELLPSCLSLIQGKVKCLDMLYMVRQSLPDSMGRQMDRQALWHNLLTSDDFSQRYVPFRNCLAEELVTVTGMSMTEAKDVVNWAFVAFLSRNWPVFSEARTGQHSLSSLKQRIQRAWRVIQILPAAARSAFLDRQLIAMMQSPREAYGKLRREREQSDKWNGMSLDRLLDTRSPFHADFLPIYQHVMRYPYGVTPSLTTDRTDG